MAGLPLIRRNLLRATYCANLFFEPELPVITLGGTRMEKSAIRENLRAFIANDLIRDPGYTLSDSEGIISGGLMDSFALAELGVYIEQAFDVYIPDPELTVANMDTLDQIVERVLKG
jgi:acyl carrier protein